MRRKIEFVWEELHTTETSQTIRAKVIGGWVVHTSIWDNKKASSSMVFVGDRDHEWAIPPLAVTESPKIAPREVFSELSADVM
jgi:hypothetical protein